MWVCGLKPRETPTQPPAAASHPMWVCGLKLDVTYVGVTRLGRTLCGCVD